LPLSDLPQGIRAIIHEIQLTAGAAEQVMLFGFMKGVEVVAGGSGPGGCPRVYQLDGTEVAIRRATARRILVRVPSQEQA
jgi:Fe2+ transport system protein FeoA